MEKVEKNISLFKIFTVFAGIGTFTIGGGYTMVPAIEKALSKRGWLSEEELTDIVALAQSAPGLLTVNMSIFAGYRLHGVLGSIMATLGSILAPFITILLIAVFFSSFKENPIVVSIFAGVRPAAVALITAYFVKLLRKNSKWWHLAITAAVLAAIVLLKISAVYILLTLLIASTAILWWHEKRSKK